MAWSFRKRIKIAPGLHLNIGKKGLSARVGGRVAGVTVGKRGALASASIPGTGLSVRQKLSAATSPPKAAGQILPPEIPTKSRGWKYWLILTVAGLATGIAIAESF